VVQHSQASLLHIVDTRHSPGRLAGGLNGRQEERYENTDDRDHDQQFHEGKTPLEITQVTIAAAVCPIHRTIPSTLTDTVTLTAGVALYVGGLPKTIRQSGQPQ